MSFFLPTGRRADSDVHGPIPAVDVLTYDIPVCDRQEAESWDDAADLKRFVSLKLRLSISLQVTHKVVYRVYMIMIMQTRCNSGSMHNFSNTLKLYHICVGCGAALSTGAMGQI